MRRGFKTGAERLAERTRTQMGLRPHDLLDIRQMAKHLDVEVIPADHLVDRARLEELERLQARAFSAATFHLPDGRTVAVYHPCNDLGRTNSDIGHELAHILLDHDVREIQQVADHTFITCNPEEEEEATWLAGCLLLPLCRAKTLSPSLSWCFAPQAALRYSLIKPWTTCPRLIRPVTSTG